MADRKTHNKIAKMIVDLPLKDIDQVNRDVDRKDFLLKYGRYHRKYWGHDMNSHAPDSMAISKGDPKREKARKIHILVDTDPKIKKAVERKLLRERLRKL